MQKLADGQDTDVGSSLAWLWSRCVGVPQPGAAPSWEAAGWLSAGSWLLARVVPTNRCTP